jgi:hypothetical protein
MHEVNSQAPNRFAQQQELLRARLLNLYPPPPLPPPDIRLLKKENAQTVEEYFRALIIEQQKAPEQDPAAAAAVEAAAERPLSKEQVIQAEEAEEDRSPGAIDIAPGRRHRHRHLLASGDDKPPSAQELRKKEKFTLLDSKAGILPDTERVRVRPISLTCVAQLLPFSVERSIILTLFRVRAIASERAAYALIQARDALRRAQFYADGRVRTVRPGVGARLHAVPPPPGLEIRTPNPPHAPHHPASPLYFYAENEAIKKEGNFLWELAVGENTLEVSSARRG